MTQPKRGTGNRFAKASTFYDHLKLALEFYNNPSILQQHSPLATPYFLRQDLSTLPTTTNQDSPSAEALPQEKEPNWGEMLALRLAAALDALWPGTAPTSSEALFAGTESDDAQDAASCYHYLVLELNYFKRIYSPPPTTQAQIYNDILHIGRTTHDRHLKEAVEHLGNILLKQLRPSMRLELPTHAGAFLGRDALLAESSDRLSRQESISFIGPGGIGKTTLATIISEKWRPNPVFWFTVRYNFSDRLPSLLFSLGYFLHQHGGSGLWLQLVANGGTIDDGNLALALTLSDLKQLSHLPLLCFDEVDLLHATDVDNTPDHHMQLLTFIESLRNHVPLLLVGQQAVIETTITFTLDRLGEPHIREWLTIQKIAHKDSEVDALASYTKGNPRLLTLCFALHQSLMLESSQDQEQTQEITLADTLARLPSAPGLMPIWLRLRRRLSPNEKSLLNAISVFREAAPEDAWDTLEDAELEDEPDDASGEENNDKLVQAPTAESIASQTIEHLHRRQLIQRDGAGGITLLPALSEIIYTEMAVEQREMAHLHAAYVHMVRGEVTEAAYHFSRGGHPEEAIRHWFPQMRDEIQRGQAAAALPVFEAISAQRLQPAQQKQLALIRGELYQLRGEPEKTAESLAQVEWGEDELHSVEAMFLWGKALDVQGETAQAQEKLDRGIDVAAHLLRELSRLHLTRGLIFIHEREMAKASKEVTWAHFHAEMLDGAIQIEKGQPGFAQKCLSNAIELAEKLADPSALGRSHYYLANAASSQEDFELAFHHYEKSIAYYKESGNKVEEAQMRTNLANNYLAAGDYQTAIHAATEALSFFKQMKSPYWSALNANTIAESYFELGDAENAEIYAMEVISYEDTQFFPFGLFTLGSVRRANQMLKEAHNLYSQSCQIAEENEDLYLLAYAQRALGEVEAELGNTDAAREHLAASLALFQQMGIQPQVEKTEQVIEGIV